MNPAKFPIGSIVFIPEPTHNHWNITTDIYGLVYDIYKHREHMVYVVLCKNEYDLYDMRGMRQDTLLLPSGICCQHLDEYRLRAHWIPAIKLDPVVEIKTFEILD
jgi:hypothetical protein